MRFLTAAPLVVWVLPKLSALSFDRLSSHIKKEREREGRKERRKEGKKEREKKREGGRKE